MGFNFIEQQRIKGAKRVEKKKKEKEFNKEITGFIKEKFQIFMKKPCNLDVFQKKFTDFIMPLKPKKYTTKQFTPVVNEFINDRIEFSERQHQKKVLKKEREKAKLKRERARRNKIKKRQEEIKKQRLYRIECEELTEDYIENPTEEKLQVLKNKGISIPETNAEKKAKQREADARKRERNIEYLDQLLAVGINPFADEWNSLPPKKYFKRFYKTVSVADYWFEDQVKMKKITKQIPDLKDYSDQNIKEINEAEIGKYLEHRAILERNNLWSVS